jgi:hypothetical protein
MAYNGLRIAVLSSLLSLILMTNCPAEEKHIVDVSFPTPIGAVKLDISFDSETNELIKRGSIAGIGVDTHRTRVSDEYDGLLVYHENESFKIGAKWEFDVAVKKENKSLAGYRIRAGAKNPLTGKFSWSKRLEIHPDVFKHHESAPAPPTPTFARMFRAVNRRADKDNCCAVPFFTKRSDGRYELFEIKEPFWKKENLKESEIDEYGELPDGPIGKMILAHRFAQDKGYATGFPDFEQDGRSGETVYGIRCINSDAVVEITDIAASQLGNPKDFTERFKAIDLWCERHGRGKFKTGFPNGEERRTDGKLFYGAVLLRREAVVGKQWSDHDLGL